jgi:hypothetical protein
MRLAVRAEGFRDLLTAESGRRAKVAGNAGLGAAVGVLLYKHLAGPWSLWGVTWPVWLAVLLALALDRGLVETLFPVTGAARRGGGPTPGILRSPQALVDNVRNFSPVGLAGLIIAYTLVMAVRGHSPRVEEPFSLVMVGVIAGVMAWHWEKGVRRDPPNARGLGAAAGVVTAALFAIAAVLLFGRHAPAVPIAKQVIVFSLSWGLYGFAGGAALDRGGAQRPGARIGMGVGAAVLALGLLNWLFDRSFPWGEEACLAAGLYAGVISLSPSDRFFGSRYSSAPR